MRTFTVRKGAFAGEHMIYDSIAEAEKHGAKNIRKPWWDPETAAGDWVQSDDGYVVQCLHRPPPLINKRHRSGQYTDLFRFPQGTFSVYYDKLGNPRVSNFYGVSSRAHKNSLGGESRLGKYMTIKKREFVLLMSMGYDPISAYVKAYKAQKSNIHQIKLMVNKLLTDPLVKEELMIAMEPFMEKVQAKVKEISGYDDLTALAVDQVAALMTMNTKSIKEKALQVNFTITMFGEPLGLTAPMAKSSTRKEIELAKYRVINPPQLGSQPQ